MFFLCAYGFSSYRRHDLDNFVETLTASRVFVATSSHEARSVEPFVATTNNAFMCRAAVARFDLSNGLSYKACPICFKQLKPKPQSEPYCLMPMTKPMPSL
ncbi:hypothetical protein D8674_000773 [Pyrus ussuriensis x Pyrus communis]|uniref:Uncharacterized protein n=1 Tax=Pyrus ussuriensis x Pyrus communis TaxID=2448454 RepID=A0A5N5F515_9ROSA|nr:hypothetical protein D8674_000773 [Pyrus ussuriensis x Pyrus communis]